MKVTFEMPPRLVQRLHSHIPIGERSKFVADLISRKLRNQGNTLERAAQKANTLGKVNRDMKEWNRPLASRPGCFATTASALVATGKTIN
jgi:hypothetical protein